MKNPFDWFFPLTLLLAAVPAKAQHELITTAPPAQRLPVLWRYCTYNLISDKDSATSCRFLDAVARVADSLNDNQLKNYATYFRRCYRLLFSINYRQYFAPGDYQTPVRILQNARGWAQQNGYDDIAAACEHNIGQVYYSEGLFGAAFEHLLKADAERQKKGYGKVPNVSVYLYELALDYFKFEEWDKAFYYFSTASRYPFYIPWAELSNLNAIGQIYARKGEWAKAEAIYRKNISRAQIYGDSAWVGIACGGLGNVFLKNRQNDSALFYHRKNYLINITNRAPEDAAKSALGVATALIRQQHFDSVLYYIQSGHALASNHIPDTAQQLEYQKNLLSVLVEFNKRRKDYNRALLYSDSLALVTENLRQRLDGKILNRAVQKIEVERYEARLKLLQSQKSLAQLRFYVLIAALCCLLLIGVLLFNRYRLKKRHQMKLAKMEKERMAAEKMQAEEKLKQAEELLTAQLNTIREKSSLIESLDNELHWLKGNVYPVPNLEAIAENREKLISGAILTDDDWRRFRNLFEQVHPGFLVRLREKFPDLSPAELRLLILTKLDLSSREMAGMLGISVEGIRKARYRLRKKLDLEEESNLESLIQEI